MFFIVGVSALLAAAMSSCGGRARGPVDGRGLSFDSIVVDTAVSATGREGSPKCALRLNILYAKGANAEVVNDSINCSGLFSFHCGKPMGSHPAGFEVRKAVDGFVRAYVENYRKECGELVRQGLAGASCNYEYVVNTSVLKGREGIVTYMAEGYSYTGGAHGVSFARAMNFDTATGKMIGLEDFFTEGCDSLLKGRLTDCVAAKFKVPGLDGLRELGVFSFADVYVPDNFILGADSVTFIYMSDEVAPHAVGEIRASLAYSDLKGCIAE